MSGRAWFVVAAVVAVSAGCGRVGRQVEGLRVVYQATPASGQAFTQATADQTAAVLRARLKSARLYGEPTVEAVADTRLLCVQLPGVLPDSDLPERLARPSLFEFRYLERVQTQRKPGAPYRMTVPSDGGSDYTFCGRKGEPVPVKKVLRESPIVLTGRDLKSNASSALSNDRHVVGIEFNDRGRRVFADFTRKHVREYLAIVLDGKILSAPIVNEAITGGKAEISGMFDAEQTRMLADSLNAGPLPVRLVVVEKGPVVIRPGWFWSLGGQ